MFSYVSLRRGEEKTPQTYKVLGVSLLLHTDKSYFDSFPKDSIKDPVFARIHQGPIPLLPLIKIVVEAELTWKYMGDFAR